MNADIIHDPTFPHGTADGFRRGCRGAHCPSPMACRDVHTRYQGDWAFRKQIDAGTPLAVIVAQEQEAARLVAEAEKAARRRRPGPRAKAKGTDGRAAANRARAEGKALIPRHVLRELLDEGLTDRQIAERVGLERRQITGARNNAGWERNPDKKGNRTSIDAKLPSVAHLDHEAAAKALNRSAEYIKRRRQIAARNQPPATSGVSHFQETT